VMRVPPDAEIERGALIARTGRRFSRSVSAPFDGRIAHVRADGDLELAPVVDRWTVRSTLDGVVLASSGSSVTVEGAAWGLQGVAGYGPDAIGDLALAIDGPADELHPGRVDVRLRDRILIGGGRSGAESIARAHACGVAAVVAGTVPAAGLRMVFGDEVSAQGSPSRADVPTVLCLLGFGSGQLPSQVFEPLLALAGSRAAVHTASARLFVFARDDIVAAPPVPPSLALVSDWGAVRPLDGPAALSGEATFASEISGPAVQTPAGPIPAHNVVRYDAPRDALV
ncbi:MAG TPA: hypothetical protein VJQ09_05205, partial [Candidatus Limnocylindria bacterium]|nr:hypothetical protein [Candidatus Limnocylindria bacterium]